MRWPGSPAIRLATTIVGAMNQCEREAIGERTRSAMRRRARAPAEAFGFILLVSGRQTDIFGYNVSGQRSRDRHRRSDA